VNSAAAAAKGIHLINNWQ